ncbi:MAG: hypothetical protein AAGD22_13190 [Verrucomicrobiota bacterium]
MPRTRKRRIAALSVLGALVTGSVIAIIVWNSWANRIEAKITKLERQVWAGSLSTAETDITALSNSRWRIFLPVRTQARLCGLSGDRFLAANNRGDALNCYALECIYTVGSRSLTSLAQVASNPTSVFTALYEGTDYQPLPPIEPFDVSPLSSNRKRAVPDSENAFFEGARLPPIEAYSELKRICYKDVEALEANSALLSQTIDALDSSIKQYREFLNGYDSYRRPLGEIHIRLDQAAVLFTASFVNSLNQGNYDQAVLDHRLSLKAHRLMEDEPDLVLLLTSIALRTGNGELFDYLLKSGSIPSATAKVLAGNLSAYQFDAACMLPVAAREAAETRYYFLNGDTRAVDSTPIRDQVSPDAWPYFEYHFNRELFEFWWPIHKAFANLNSDIKIAPVSDPVDALVDRWREMRRAFYWDKHPDDMSVQDACILITHAYTRFAAMLCAQSGNPDIAKIKQHTTQIISTELDHLQKLEAMAAADASFARVVSLAYE